MGQALSFLLPPNANLPIAIGGELSIPTLAFTLLISLVATIVSGTVPALLSARADLNEVLKEGGRGGSAGAHSHRMRGLLVTAEVALAMIALVGAGLFFRSFRNASNIQPGFDTHNISVSQFYLSYAGYSAQEQRQFCRTLRERLEAIPGVTAVSYSDAVPLSELLATTTTHQLQVEGYIPSPDEQMRIHYSTAPPGHFNLMGIPFRDGRDFTERDEAGAPGVIIINETFARRFFRGANPIGRKVRVASTPTTVVGVVKDSKYHSPIEAPIPFFYIPFRQWFAPGLNFAFLIKTTGDPMRVIPALRREALALNQDAAFTSMTLADAITTSLYPQKVAASLLCVVGVVSLLLVAVGLYSVMSYAISQRTHELGIRMALGAQPADVLRLVGRQTLTLTLPGLLAGILAALAASRFVANMLVNVSAADPATIAAVAVFLGLVALLAGYVPAFRATRLEPTTALRCQ
jgi:predicted permease